MSEVTTISREGVRRPVVVAPDIAARAVALCEGCPMAKFCMTKNTGDCLPQVKQQMIERPIDGGGVPAPIRSYRKDLLDDSVPVVMANLQKKPQPKRPEPRPTHLPLPKAVPKPTIKPLEKRERRPRRVAESNMTAIGRAASELAQLIFGGGKPDGAVAKK